MSEVPKPGLLALMRNEVLIEAGSEGAERRKNIHYTRLQSFLRDKK